MNSATACQTGAHAAAVAFGSTLPGTSVSLAPRTSSEARGFAIVTRSASSTAMTPVATFANTRAVRSRASSSAAWLRRTSVAIRSNALRTGSNSRGVPGGKAGGSLPRPTAMAGARVDGRLELVLERAPEDLGSEKWIDQTELPQHGRARGHEYATAIQPQFGVEPAAQLDQGASDRLGRILGDGFGTGGGVAERLANEQIAGATSILGQVGKAPRRKSEDGQDEKCDEHRRELRAITGAQRRNQGRQPRAAHVGAHRVF